MYPDTILGWFVGTFIIFLVMVGMGMFAYIVGHKIDEWEAKRKKKEDGDGTSDE